MADLNVTYSGTLDQQDPDVVVGSVPKFPFGSNPLYLPDAVRAKIRETNAKSELTTSSVKIAYSGSTPADRLAWLNERINSINDRVKFIKGRTDELLSRLQNLSGDSYAALSKVIVSALSLVPVVGTAITLISNQANSAQALEQLKVTTLIQDYASDLKQLATIRNQLLAELVKADPTSVDPTNEAPTVPTWYYFVGIGLLLLIFVWLRRRNQTRRKR